MEIWIVIHVTVILMLNINASLPTYCEKEKSDCQLAYIGTQKYKALHCPNIPLEDEKNITWHYRRTSNTSWTSFPFYFCDESLHFDTPECEIKNGELRLDGGESAYEGFYECRTKYSKHCFELKLYDCTKRKGQVVFKPPETILVAKGNPLRINCGAYFGCDKSIKGQISWEVNGIKITSSDKRYHICERSNITYTEAELLIEEVEEDDFHHEFVCAVEESYRSKVRRFIVSLINKDQVQIVSKWIEIVVPGLLCLILLLIVSLWCFDRKFPLVFFFIKTNFSCLSQLHNTRNTRYDIFILHEQDDSDLAQPILEELSCHYKVCTPENIQGGTDFLQSFKEFIEDCSSMIVIYPQYPIAESFDHMITVAKETLKPYLISSIIFDERQWNCTSDERWGHLKLKKCTFDRRASIFDQLYWRLPRISTQNNYHVVQEELL